MIIIISQEHVNKLLPIFEKFLKKAPASGDFDAARSGVIVLMGTLARHLDSDDPKLKPIVNKLIEALSTPSQQVIHMYFQFTIYNYVLYKNFLSFCSLSD